MKVDNSNDAVLGRCDGLKKHLLKTTTGTGGQGHWNRQKRKRWVPMTQNPAVFLSGKPLIAVLQICGWRKISGVLVV